MRALTLSLAALAVAMPLPALAQDYPADTYDDAPLADAEPGLAELSARLSDPVEQQRMARTLQTLSELVMALPVAPLAEAAAEMAGEDPRAIDPDLTVRDVAPGAEALQDDLDREVPRAMGALAGVMGGLEAMLPALRDMADRLEEAYPARN